MTKERKQEVINAFKREENDTGSSERLVTCRMTPTIVSSL